MSARHEDEFETYLRQRSVLPGRLTSSERIEPPKDLDAIVLERARRAIHAPPPMRLYRAPRWALPVALAATLLLSFSIVLNISLTMRPPAQPASTGETARAVAPPPAARQQPASAPAPASPPPATMTRAAPEVFNRAPAGESRATGADGDRAGRSNSGAAPPSEAARRMVAPAARAQSDAAIASKALPDPAAWLRRIEALRAQGRTAEADAELRRFRRSFPDFPQSKLPPALRDPPQ